MGRPRRNVDARLWRASALVRSLGLAVRGYLDERPSETETMFALQGLAEAAEEELHAIRNALNDAALSTEAGDAPVN